MISILVGLNSNHRKKEFLSFSIEWRVGSHMKLLRDDDKSEHPDSNDFVQVQTLASFKVE